MVTGGISGPAAIASDADASRLVKAASRVDDLAMPPDEPLSAEEVAVLEAWVSRGLPWSGPGSGRDGYPSAVPRDMESRIASALESHWSLQQPRQHSLPPIPAGVDAAIAQQWNGRIDRFLLHDAAAAGVEP